MRTEKHEKVLEKLATSDKATIVIERQTELKCALRQGLTLFCAIGCSRSARRRRPAAAARGARKPDERDPPIECYDTYGPGPSVSAYASDVSDYAGNRLRTVSDHAGR